MGGDHTEVLFQGWANKYGDVVHVRILNQPVVILSTLEAARDLFEKRSSIYSDRPRFVLLSELMGWHSATTHTRYGPRFRKHRRFIQQIFNQRASAAFHPIQQRQTLVLLDDLIRTPDLFVRHFKRFAAATIFPITYGLPITSVDDELVKLAEEAATLTVESGSPAATLVDFFPVMRHIPTWLPFAGFKRQALKTRMAVNKMMTVPFDMVKKEMRSGQAPPSFTSKLLETYCDPSKVAPHSEDEEEIKGAAGTLFAAAEDTTVAVMQTFVLAMVRNPGVFRKVQDEMDRVVGTERLPTLDDRGSLPYLECVLKEVLRWNPPAPLGLPHRLMEDDVYRGYHIPKGASVFTNIFAILQDCFQPDIFRPERHMDESDLPDPRDVVFGFGRRICPGRHFAESSAWTMMANIIATMDISRTPRDKENGVFPEYDVIGSFVRHPKPYECSIRPRSAKITSLIQEAKTNAEF
ncbi:putative cytochrome p450 [Lyophyllum shimeji]|uniref:Cytochrome p450 n=1 Tax=Lyophyllum shimeji TaxID=47721 RepID=A0A9P3PYZ2_LYOSH|nr:putative cytochrome p450 [Lyophyllum shimeji]